MKFDEIKNKTTTVHIQHVEDLVIWEGSEGAVRSVEIFKALSDDGVKNLTVKWDGSPAIIFGRNDHGQFVFTDKTGFRTKQYDGKATSADAVHDMFLNRANGRFANDPDRRRFAEDMARLYPIFEKAVPGNVRGYFKGDLLYASRPMLDSGTYRFKPNTVAYSVKADSPLGKQIGSSDAGIVVHRRMTEEGFERPVGSIEELNSGALLIMPPVPVEEPVNANLAAYDTVLGMVERTGASLDKMLDPEVLVMKRMKDFPEILSRYLNSKVDTGLDNFTKQDFENWLITARVSDAKKPRIMEHIEENETAFKALWMINSSLMQLKDKVVEQLDNRNAVVDATINGQPGGEGYVYTHPMGDVKFVSRKSFSAANRAVER